MLKEYEKEAIRILAKGKLSDETIREVISSGVTDIEFTGAGYFLTIINNLLPVERIVLNKPLLEATSDGVMTGLLVIIENSVLTLECHSWGNDEVPDNFRESDVTIKIT